VPSHKIVNVQTIDINVNCTDSNEKYNMINLRLNKLFLKSLIDSGATVSCLRHDIYVKSGLMKQFPIEKSDISHVRGVSGITIKILGKVTLPFTISRLTVVHSFYVLEDMSLPVILGVDFLKNNKSKVSWENNTLEIQGGIVATPLLPYNNPCSEDKPKIHLVRPNGNYEIPPHSQVILPAHINKSVSHNIYLLEPVSSLFSTKLLMGARTICNIDPHSTTVYYQVLNPTNSSIYLNSAHPIAKLSLLSQENISEPLFGTDAGSSNQNSGSGVHDVTSNQPSNVNFVSDPGFSPGNLPAPSKVQATDNKLPLPGAHYERIARDMGFSLTDSDLTPEQKSELFQFLGKHRSNFATNLSEIGCTSIYEHRIDTGDALPVKQRAYRTTPAIRKEIDKQVDELETHGIISKSFSNWQSPIVMIKKRSGHFRMCTDLRKLNKLVKPLSYPLPRFDDTFDTLAESKSKIFSVLDLSNAFWNVKLSEDTKHKTAFVTHRGCYTWNRLPFGLTDSPLVFSMVMTQALHEVLNHFALVYIDDILIFSQNWPSHLNHLGQVFDKLEQAGMRMAPEKCHFAMKSVKYLGHVITKDGIAINKEKTKVVESFPRPKSAHDIRAFQGLCNFYRKFIKDYAHIAAPLNNLLRKDTKFVWSPECEQAFKTLKKHLISSPILAYPCFDRQFILYCDASKQAIGYILGQKDENGKEHVISYGGRSLKKHEQNLGITDLELLALVEGVKYYHVYLADNNFQIVTDHLALKSLPTNKNLSGKLGRYAMFLQNYRYEIVHRPGLQLGNADALSRRSYLPSEETAVHNISAESMPTMEYVLHYPNHEQLCQISCTSNQPQDTFKNLLQAETQYNDLHPVQHLAEIMPLNPVDLKTLQREDAELSPYIKYLQNETIPEDNKLARRVIMQSQDYIMENDILFHLYYPRGKGKQSDRIIKQLVVPKVLRNDVLLAYHDALTACHQGIERTYNSIRLKYFWPKQYAQIETYVKTCQTCQQSKNDKHAKKAPLHPIPPDDVFGRIHMDFLELKKTKTGYKYLLLIVDSFSKWCEAYPMKSMEAAAVAKIFYDEFITRYGAPSILVTDRGQNFMSKLIKSLCDIFQITKLATSSYHAQTNSHVERFNSVICQTLRAYCDKDQDNWPDIIPSIMLAYRMSPATQGSTYSPYFLCFGREMRLPFDVAMIPNVPGPQNISAHLQKIIENHEISRIIATENILKSQQKYKLQYDKKSRTPPFKVGDRCWLYCAKTPKSLKAKLVVRWIGPNYITQVLSNHTYKLRKCSDNKLIRNVVHANRLKQFYDPETRPTNPPDMFRNDRRELNPEELLDTNEDDTNANNTQPDTNPGTSQTQDNPVGTQGTQAENSQSQSKDKWLKVEKLLKSAMIRGTRHYLIKWADHTIRPSWEPSSNVPNVLIREFHVNKTLSGHKRKRPLMPHQKPF
jgi:transposase InsO family protein